MLLVLSHHYVLQLLLLTHTHITMFFPTLSPVLCPWKKKKKKLGEGELFLAASSSAPAVKLYSNIMIMVKIWYSHHHNIRIVHLIPASFGRFFFFFSIKYGKFLHETLVRGEKKRRRGTWLLLLLLEPNVKEWVTVYGRIIILYYWSLLSSWSSSAMLGEHELLEFQLKRKFVFVIMTV